MFFGHLGYVDNGNTMQYESVASAIPPLINDFKMVVAASGHVIDIATNEVTSIPLAMIPSISGSSSSVPSILLFPNFKSFVGH